MRLLRCRLPTRIKSLLNRPGKSLKFFLQRLRRANPPSTTDEPITSPSSPAEAEPETHPPATGPPLRPSLGSTDSHPFMLEREMTPRVLPTSSSRAIPPPPPALMPAEPVENHPASVERLEEQVSGWSFSTGSDDDRGSSSHSEPGDGDSGLGEEMAEREGQGGDVGGGGDEGLWIME